MSEMLEQGHLRMLGEGGMAYELTEHGRSTAKQFYKDVPLAVRERCERELQRQLTLGRRMRENSVVIRPEGDGYVITLEIPDIGASLMKLSLFVPTKELCEQVKRRFLNDPQLTYKGVIALVTGDLGTVGSLIPSGEELFD